MSYRGFRLGGRNAVAIRPPDKPLRTPGGRWARDRSSAGADDGTDIDATILNQINANLENTVVGLGGEALLDHGDYQLRDAVMAYVAAVIDALPGEKYLQGLAGYNATTNILTLAISDGSTVDVSMAGLIADAVADRIAASEKGAANGVATLDGAGKVPTAQLPTPASATWGSVGGTLTAQTDLQTALNARATLAGGNAFTGTATNTFTIASGANVAVHGINSGTGVGVKGDSSGSNYGVYGAAAAYHSVGGLASGGFAGLIGFNGAFTTYGMVATTTFSFDGVGAIRNAGLIESTSGGFKFPDASVQTTAATDSIGAWVNFNGTGTVAIRSSKNVTSITDHGVGQYTVNFTTALPNADYAVVGDAAYYASGFTYSTSVAPKMASATTFTTKTTTACRIYTGSNNDTELVDCQHVSVSFLK